MDDRGIQSGEVSGFTGHGAQFSCIRSDVVEVLRGRGNRVK
jgi:hypothetical protein